MSTTSTTSRCRKFRHRRRTGRNKNRTRTGRNRTVGGRTPTRRRNRSTRIQNKIIDNSIQKDNNCKGENLFHSYTECAENCNRDYCDKKVYQRYDPEDVFYDTHRYAPHKSRHPSKVTYRTPRFPKRDWTPTN